MQVAAKLQVEDMESRQQAITEVIVDLLLDMEEITVDQGLFYVLDKLESYPVSAMEWQQCTMCKVFVCLSFYSGRSWLVSC